MDMYQKRKIRKEKRENSNQNEKFHKVVLNWYPGHMAKTKKLIQENMNLIDIIYEVIDARIPYSSKIKDIDEMINNKPKILIITKMDLCDKEETNKFIEKYRNDGYIVVPVDLNKNVGIEDIIIKTKDALKPLDEKRELKGLKKRSYRALIIGIPNVGKSTLINRLVGKKVTVVGNMPGVTKSLSWIRINNDIDLLDSPGILWPKLDNEEVALNLVSMSAIKEDVVKLSDIVVHILNKLYTYYPNKLKERYGIDTIDFDDISKTIEEIGRKRGCLLKGNVIDYEKVYKLILRDIRESNIKNITFDRFND